jgi:nucleoside-diphosphate-sugar epimerase
VLGGTGFIGTALVSRLRAAGLTVSVMARNPTNLPAQFDNEGVTVRRGDIRNKADVAQAIAGTKCVVNLAHGGGGTSWPEIRDSMVGGAETVASACVADNNKTLIYVGSIAALYLGPRTGVVLGSEHADPLAERRSDYARAKALCETRLDEMRRQFGLAVTVLRPGLVVGPGTSPLHSGLGFFNNSQHCIGWNEGRNPLPFVLVDDVAAAITLFCGRPATGRSYNLVGDVRPSAREYLANLACSLERPLRYHAKSPNSIYLSEVGKWCIKRIGGRSVPMPSLRDIISRGLKAQFDCSDVKSELGWSPVSDREIFYSHAFGRRPAP